MTKSKQRSTESAMNAVAESIEQVVQQGGIVYESSLFDVNEMALDGASQESMVERLKQARAKPYVPRGGWVER